MESGELRFQIDYEAAAALKPRYPNFVSLGLGLWIQHPRAGSYTL